ncbi:hypothetical protein ABPG72_021785 [Tetrahymena utriculariae]
MGEETLKRVNQNKNHLHDDIKTKNSVTIQLYPCQWRKKKQQKPPGQTCNFLLLSKRENASKSSQSHNLSLVLKNTIHIESNLTDDGLQIDDPKDGPTGQNVVGQYDHRLPLMAYQNTLIIYIKQILKEQFITL